MSVRLKDILEIQEKDLNMLRLMELKQKRGEELERAVALRNELNEQLLRKRNAVLELKKDSQLAEVEIREIEEKIKKLDSAASSVKKVDEFNALNREITESERKKTALEHKIEEHTEKLVGEEEVLASLQESLDATTESSAALEREIQESLQTINKEGRVLQGVRAKLAEKADSEVLRIYEQLLANKRDRVVVPVEHRTCSGCHIVLTAQHENLVRKGERLVFCEHCSRIHYWQESEALEGTAAAPRRRRRSPTKSAA